MFGRHNSAKVAAIVLVAMLSIPVMSFARTITIDSYTTSEADSGEGWEFDGEDGLLLDSYDGGSIYAGPSTTGNEFVITVNGENKITDEAEVTDETKEVVLGIYVEGDARIAGDCIEHDTLTIETTVNNSTDLGRGGHHGAILAEGDLTIENLDLSVSHRMGEGHPVNVSAIMSEGDLTVRDADVYASTYDEFAAGLTRNGLLSHGNILIKNSNVTALSPSGYSNHGIGLTVSDRPLSLTIVDSNVRASGGYAIFTNKFSDAGPEASGSIQILGSSRIVSPEGADVIEYGHNPECLTIGIDGVPSSEVIITGNVTRPGCTCPAEPEPEPAPEPTPTPEPTPAPEPAPAPTSDTGTVLPKTTDASLVLEAAYASSGLMLLAASILRRRRAA